MRPGMSVRPPPSMTVTLASADGWILTLETRSMMFPRTITLLGPASFSALPSKIRTFLNRVTATLGAAAAALTASGPAGGDDTAAGVVVVGAPVAAPPASDPDGAPDGAQPAQSMSATIAARNRTLSRIDASLAGSRLAPDRALQRRYLLPELRNHRAHGHRAPLPRSGQALKVAICAAISAASGASAPSTCVIRARACSRNKLHAVVQTGSQTGSPSEKQSKQLALAQHPIGLKEREKRNEGDDYHDRSRQDLVPSNTQQRVRDVSPALVTQQSLDHVL